MYLDVSDIIHTNKYKKDANSGLYVDDAYM